MEKPYNYRNKLQYPVGRTKEGSVMGVFAKRSHRIIPNENCHIQNKLTQAIAKDVFNFVIENNIHFTMTRYNDILNKMNIKYKLTASELEEITYDDY